MPPVHRILDAEPVTSLDDYVGAGGGRGLEAAQRLGPAGAIEDIEASGLRGRGGAGFPTGIKWKTVAENTSPAVPTSVVINAAEGEPGSFKDRILLRRNPYRVLEGALCGAVAMAADRLVVAVKASFETERRLLEQAVAEIEQAGWAEGIDVSIFAGPSEYLYGEESGLLEALAGRAPFPRVAPPYRHGLEELGDASGSSAAQVEMASPGDGTPAPPTLVNNVETFANVAAVLAEGPDWLRSLGTVQSPGTIVCTVTGHTATHGVAEFPMGTPLEEIVSTVGGDPEPGTRFTALMSGVAHPLVPADLWSTPATYEDMEEIGSGLGAAGFIVFDDATDVVAVAHGVAHFLAVESCGQCTPCKQDGLAIADFLDRVRRSDAGDADLAALADLVTHVSEEARCYLAHQQQRVVDSVLRLYPDDVRAHAGGGTPPADVELIAPVADIVDGRAVLDESQATKQPDWTHEATWSGKWPAEAIDQRAE